MELSKSIKVDCTSNELMSFFIRQTFAMKNDNLAKELGIHPTAASREKTRAFELACKAITALGLPEDSVKVEGKPPRLVVEGADAEWLMQMLEIKGKVKRKAPAVTEAKSQINLLLDED